jgi:hypothetical protein
LFRRFAPEQSQLVHPKSFDALPTTSFVKQVYLSFLAAAFVDAARLLDMATDFCPQVRSRAFWSKGIDDTIATKLWSNFDLTDGAGLDVTGSFRGRHGDRLSKICSLDSILQS